VLGLVGLIYDASTAPALWRVFLDKFADAVQGESTGLIHYDASSRSSGFSARVRVDPGALRPYGDYYAAKDEWWNGALKRRLGPGSVFLGEELCPNEVFARGEFYNDFLQPLNIFHEMGALILKTGPVFCCLTSHRAKSAGAFGENETRLLKELLPHLERALQVHRRIVGLETQFRAAADTLDRLPFGLILVDRRGKPLKVNRAAKAILDQNDGLSVTRENLSAALAGEAALLRRMIHGVALTSQGTGTDSGGVMTVSRPSLKRRFAVLVTPLAANALELGGDRPAAAVFVSDPELLHEPDAKILARLFGLTPAESKMATLLMQGKSAEDASNELAISLNTARTHVKRVLEKTDTRRQSQLIRLLLNSPAGLRFP
jgi:DNA-binding CsgD family transcriptional regulator/PAS domain-containing protein